MVILNRIGSDVNKGLLPPVLPLFDNAKLVGGVMAKFRWPWGTTGVPLESEDLPL